MTLFEALLYGVAQGVTEYLPVSSSAHLILLPKFLGTQDPGLAFDVFLHLGTLFATLIYFWRDWFEILRQLPVVGAFFRTRGPQAEISPTLPWTHIVIATLPALIAGAALHQWVESVFRGNAVLCCTLVIGGLLLYGSDRLTHGERPLGEAKMRDALVVGLMQCLALVPGMSRSGSTMTGARLLGFDRESAARFSFLLSAPVTAAALVWELRHFRALLENEVGVGPLLVAGVSSFLFGWLAIGGLLMLLRKFGYLSFAIYRVALAITIYRVLGI